MPSDRFSHPDYDIVRTLGRGGAGTVYLARHKLLGRPEVLKVPAADLLRQPGMRERFVQEMKAIASLVHPNVVITYGVVTLPAGLALAMEYIDGPDLDELVTGHGPLPPGRAARYAVQVCQALSAAHRLGMVHRDIKPANLMRTVQNGQGVVKVLDFGLAKLRSEEAAETRLTATGQILGTPDYMAPEQARDPAAADIRADLYSLGCTLYFLLTGRTPFPRPSLIAVFDAHRYDDPPPLPPDVPQRLAAVVRKLMAKKPGERFQTPDQAAAALLSAAGTAPVAGSGTVPTLTAKPVPPRQAKRLPGERMSTVYWAEGSGAAKKAKPPRRKATHKPTPEWVLPAVIGATGCLALAAVVGFVLMQSDKPTPPPVAKKPAEDPPPVVRKPTADEPPAPEEEPKLPPDWPAGFRPLFAGGKLTGWSDPTGTGNWAVKDGLLVGKGTGGALVYDGQTFANARVWAKVRAAAGACGGMAVRCPNGGGGYLNAITADDAVAEKTGSLFRERQVVARRSDSVVRPGEWFTLEVIAVGDRVESRVNGRPIAQYTDPLRAFGDGRVALRTASEVPLEFAAVGVRDLPAAEPADGPAVDLTARNDDDKARYTFTYDPSRTDGTWNVCELETRLAVFPGGVEPLAAGHLRPGETTRFGDMTVTIPAGVPPDGHRLFVFRNAEGKRVPLLLTVKQSHALPRGTWKARVRVVAPSRTLRVITGIERA
jgi:serine/threonine protein kinase